MKKLHFSLPVWWTPDVHFQLIGNFAIVSSSAKQFLISLHSLFWSLPLFVFVLFRNWNLAVSTTIDFKNHELLRRNFSNPYLKNSAWLWSPSPSWSRSNSWSGSRTELSRNITHFVPDGFATKRCKCQSITGSEECATSWSCATFVNTSRPITTFFSKSLGP